MPDSKIDDYWLHISDLTIYDAAFWMAHKFDPRDNRFDPEYSVGPEFDPRAHALYMERSASYADYFEGSGGLAAVQEKCELLISAIRAGSINLSGETYLNDQTINVGKTRILKSDWLTWCEENSYSELASQFAINGNSKQVVGAVRGITKRKVAIVFADLHFSYGRWMKNLASPPNWLLTEGIRVAKGNKKTSATWNPVLIAVALFDKPKITIRQLDAVFVALSDWGDEWREASEGFR